FLNHHVEDAQPDYKGEDQELEPRDTGAFAAFAEQILEIDVAANDLDQDHHSKEKREDQQSIADTHGQLCLSVSGNPHRDDECNHQEEHHHYNLSNNVFTFFVHCVLLFRIAFTLFAKQEILQAQHLPAEVDRVAAAQHAHQRSWQIGQA